MNQSEFDATLDAARRAGMILAALRGDERSALLRSYAARIRSMSGEILEANTLDLSMSAENGVPPVMVDRLALNAQRLEDMAAGVEKVAALDDPVGIVLDDRFLHAGPRLQKISVPLGVIGIIYEARPNVTSDSVALCLKSANACVLRGGKEAINSNSAIAWAMTVTLEKAGLPSECVVFINDVTREGSGMMMRAKGKIDVLIPRGSAGLIDAVKEEARVPVIETGAGNCHAYIEKTADLELAAEIVDNAKTQRPSVCNSIETLLIDRPVAREALAAVQARLAPKGVEMRCCPESLEILGEAGRPATRDDYYTEFNDLILAVKVVDGVKEAVDHINRHSTSHSECIITNDMDAARYFTERVDSAAVYVNASTRFTDGEIFGFGAEIGISTQKLHARGPMALRELTSWKYVIWGNGETRR